MLQSISFSLLKINLNHLKKITVWQKFMQELNSPVAFRKDEPHLAIIKISSGTKKVL